MPFSVAEFEVMFVADTVITLRLVENEKELLDELDDELELVVVPDVLKLIFTV